LPTGEFDFKEIIARNYEYVDKTGFIKEYLGKRNRVTALLRPRRFGKTLMLSTLKYFFDIKGNEENRKLFERLEIKKSRHFEEQGQYPVIDLTFKGVKEGNWEECFEKIKSVISKEYRRHEYIIKGSSLWEPSELDKKYYNSVVNESCSKVKLSESLEKLSKYLQAN